MWNRKSQYENESHKDPHWEQGHIERRYVRRGDKYVPIDERLDDLESHLSILQSRIRMLSAIMIVDTFLAFGSQGLPIFQKLIQLIGK